MNIDANLVEREKVWSMPIDQIDVSKGYLFEQDIVELYFQRLRKEDPVHRSFSKRYGHYWSVTSYRDIMAVDTNHASFSSESGLGGIALAERPPSEAFPSFIAMDQPRHSAQRKTVSPMFTPTHLDELAKLIRSRSIKVLDELPRNVSGKLLRYTLA